MKPNPQPDQSKKKVLYWVKFVNQGTGEEIDSYYIAHNLAQLDETFADILEIKVISNVEDLTEETTL